MLAMQMAAPNSPQWFNTGLHWAYGIDGPSQGHFYVDPETGELKRSDSSYERPQPHACFIQGVSDDLVNEGGIMDLWVREARLFKYGSGTGTNFSNLRARGETLSGGGQSSGLMSFLQDGRPGGGLDQVRRHHTARGQDGLPRCGSPGYRSLHQLEGGRGAEGLALVAGSKLAERHLKAVMQACHDRLRYRGRSEAASTPSRTRRCQRHRAARASEISENYVQRTSSWHVRAMRTWNSRPMTLTGIRDAYLTVAGQNSNNSVRADQRLPGSRVAGRQTGI